MQLRHWIMQLRHPPPACLSAVKSGRRARLVGVRVRGKICARGYVLSFKKCNLDLSTFMCSHTLCQRVSPAPLSSYFLRFLYLRRTSLILWLHAPALRLAVSLSVFPSFYDINFQPVSFSFTHSLSPSPSRAFCVSSLFLSFFSAEQSLLFVTGISTMDSILVSPL